RSRSFFCTEKGTGTGNSTPPSSPACCRLVDIMKPTDGSRVPSLSRGGSMIHRIAAGASVALVLLVGSVRAESPKSGRQTGDKIPGPFSPLNVTGDDAGQKRCLV